jgi:hypothetical protein
MVPVGQQAIAVQAVLVAYLAEQERTVPPGEPQQARAGGQRVPDHRMTEPGTDQTRRLTRNPIFELHRLAGELPHRFMLEVAPNPAEASLVSFRIVRVARIRVGALSRRVLGAVPNIGCAMADIVVPLVLREITARYFVSVLCPGTGRRPQPNCAVGAAGGHKAAVWTERHGFDSIAMPR